MKIIQLLLLTMSLTLSTAFAVNVDLKASSLEWSGEKVTGDAHMGKITMKKASVELKDGKIVKGDFLVDMNSFTVTNLSGEWADKFIGHMKSEDFFTVKKYPTASLKIKSVKGITATADLTIKGKVSEVNFDLANKDNTHAGVLVFDRTKFGVIYGSGNFFKGLGDKMIKNDIKIKFKIVTK